jgi:HPt (histidine-containing phosphotransfer) domain-containing protein
MTAATALPPAGASAFDHQMEVLGELFEGDSAAIVSLLNAAIASIRVDAGRIATGAQDHDAETLIAAAHRLRGTSGNLGANGLIEIAALIERAPKENCWTVAPSLLAGLARCVDVLNVRVEAYVKQNVVTHSV